jgi:hypothetical protein
VKSADFVRKAIPHRCKKPDSVSFGMPRVLATVFLISYLLCFTPARQLTRIPVLLEHYQEHRLEDTTLSFVQFLRIHYVDEVVVDDDYNRDQELPLRCNESRLVLLILPLIGTTQFSVLEPPLMLLCFRPIDDADERAGWGTDIWHPPKHIG